MPSIVQLQALLLLSLISFVLAVPTNNAPIQKRSFKVERVANPAYQGRSVGAGTRALIKAHRKYGVSLPPGLVDAMSGASVDNADDRTQSEVQVGHGVNLAKEGRPKSKAANSTGNGTGIVTATPEKGDIAYLSPVMVGGQLINMDFDTGSSDLWVFGKQLPQSSQVGHTVYDPRKSTSSKVLTGATWSISYGDKSGANGTVVLDTVNIGGAIVENQAVEMASVVSNSFVADPNANGLVGLAYSKLNTVLPKQQKTFFDNAMPSLAMPVFTADLRHNAVGAYEFGQIDSSKFDGPLNWAAVNTSKGFWQFSSNKFQVGNGQPMTTTGGQAIADTGTTLMLANPAIIQAYYSQVDGAELSRQAGGVIFPCNNNLPDLAVDVGGSYMATIRGKDINFAPVDTSGTTCFGGLQAIDSKLQIYGDILFKSQFVVFNGGNNSLGMAPHK